MWSLFVSFFKVGAFTFGGGYAMIAPMQREVVERNGWLTENEFLDQVALSQAMPGAFAVNMAASVGYREHGVVGAVVAVAATIMVPIAVILLLAVFFRQFSGNEVVEHIFMAVRPCVVALIAAPVFTMARASHISWRTCWIPILSALLIWAFGVSPVVVVAVAAVLGGLMRVV
ncbi:MAG: chromate transporter [Bacteroidales bacterium]|nr:chromate transporter [Candidatus Colimorpha onthohippi]